MAPPPGSARRNSAPSAFYLWLTGFTSILAQVVLLRELSIAFYGVELIYVLAIGVWMVGTGFGAWMERSGTGGIVSVQALFLVFALILVLDIALVRQVRTWLGEVPGAYSSLPGQLIGMSTVLLPVSVLSGVIFARAAASFIRAGQSAATAYSIECAGAAVGGGLGTLSLHSGLSNSIAGCACALFTALAVLSEHFGSRVTRTERHKSSRWLVPAALALAALCTVAISRNRDLDLITAGWNHPHAAAVRDTPYCRIVVSERCGQAAVYVNGALSFETEGTASEELAHPAALQVESLRTVLLLGGGPEGTLREILKHGPMRVDYVELDHRYLSTVTPHLPNDVREAMNDGRVHLSIADPRRALRCPGGYDLIMVAMPDPTSAQANRFYTREFFHLVRDRLAPGGVLAFRLRSAENFWSDPLTARNASVVKAARNVFCDVIVLPGVSNIVLSATTPLSRDLQLFTDRFRERKLQAKLVSAEYLRYLYTNDRLVEIQQTLAKGSSPPNSDSQPVCYFHSLSMWLAKFYPRLITTNSAELVESRALRWWGGMLVMAAGGLFLLSRRTVRLRLSLLTATAGFAGILTESALILRYQAMHGVLYRDLGVLLMLFMMGMSAGALLPVAAMRYPSLFRALARRDWLGHAVLLGFAVTCSLAAWTTQHGLLNGAMAIGILLLLTGFGAGGVFGVAGQQVRTKPERSVSLLYAADLLGGGIGTVMSSLLVIPVFGLTVTLGIAALALLLSLLLI